MQPWSGLAASRHKDPEVRNDIMEIDRFLHEVSNGLANVQRGEVPDSSGDHIGDNGSLLDYFFLPGRVGGQIAIGGNIPSDKLTLKGSASLSSPTITSSEGWVEIVAPVNQGLTDFNLLASSTPDGTQPFSITNSGHLRLKDSISYVAPGGIGLVLDVWNVQNTGIFSSDVALFRTGSWTSGLTFFEIAKFGPTGVSFLSDGNQSNYLVTISRRADLTTNTVLINNSAMNAASSVLTVRGKSGQTGNLTTWQDSTPTTLSFIDSTGAFNGPVVSTLTTFSGNSLFYNDPNTYHATSGVSYSSASTTITSSAAFGSLQTGMYAFGANIPIGATLTRVNNSTATLSVLPTGSGTEIYFGFGQFWKHRTLNRYWKLAGDSEDDAVTTYTVNRTANDHDPILPTTNYPNAFLKSQTITGTGGVTALSVLPSGADAFGVDDGIGGQTLTISAAGQVVSGVPDKWWLGGLGTTFSLTHSLSYASASQTATWPEVSGTVVISPTPLSITNTSSNVVAGVLHSNTSSNKFFRVGVRINASTAGDRTCTFTIKYTDGTARQIPITSPPLASGVTFGATHFFRVGSGNITYDLTFSGTTGTADVFALVERMS